MSDTTDRPTTVARNIRERVCTMPFDCDAGAESFYRLQRYSKITSHRNKQSLDWRCVPPSTLHIPFPFDRYLLRRLHVLATSSSCQSAVKFSAVGLKYFPDTGKNKQACVSSMFITWTCIVYTIVWSVSLGLNARLNLQTTEQVKFKDCYWTHNTTC